MSSGHAALECWPCELEGAQRLQTMFEPMKRVTERMELTLGYIRQLETAMLVR